MLSPTTPGSEDFGGWGDRFVQLGDWRLAAIDEDNFAFVHKNGKNSEVWANLYVCVSLSLSLSLSGSVHMSSCKLSQARAFATQPV